jgi:radical SAM protein with 4Fe4S-binding SPASM domain
MNLIFNPAYVLRPEKGCAMLLPKESVLNFGDPTFEIDFAARIHSIHGAILSFFNGQKTETAKQEAAELLDVPIDDISSFVDKISENESSIGVVFREMLIMFPKNTLIYSDTKREDLPSPFEFDYEETELKVRRLQSPNDITIMVNTRCATDCFYCYADRRIVMDCQIPFNRIKEIIREARSLHIRAVNVIGGEFFLYKNWKQMLSYCHQYNYFPAVSTKVPIAESSIKFLADTGTSLQVSLDTLIKDSLCVILDVKESYADKIKKMLLTLDKYKVNVFIHSVMTCKNDNVEDIESIYEFIKTLKNIVSWRLDKTAASLYKGVENYALTKPNGLKLNQQVEKLTEWSESAETPFKIYFSGIISVPVVEGNADAAGPLTEHFPERSICSANQCSMFILPDGKVTGCEELYWIPQFQLGNILEQSIMDIWNSDLAKAKHFIKQEDIPRESACSTCEDFEECRYGKGICYRDIMKAYGQDNWFYPDVNCPKAVKQKNEIMVL